MKLIFTDILKHWTNCRVEAILAGILFMVVGKRINHRLKRQKPSAILFFADGLFLYYLLHVTLLSRSIGLRREVELIPFTNPELMNGEFHYLIENILLFIPFGILLYRTLYAYDRKCSMRAILLAAFLTSVLVELLQYVFSCGKSETDDVIANVLGALIGYILIKAH